MNPNGSPSMSGGTKTIFDQYNFDNRSPNSDFNGTFDSLSGSRRPSAAAQAISSSPSTRFSPMMSSVLGNERSSPHLADSSLAETQSIKSNSSSLRDAYATLKGGIFPPGVRSKRPSMHDTDDEEGSDGSHYDGDEYSFEGDGPFQKPESPVKPTLDSGKGSTTNQDIYTNALDSPDVPLRRSSVLASQPVTASNSRNSAIESVESSPWKGVTALKEDESMQNKNYPSSPRNRHIPTGSTSSQASFKKGAHTRNQPSFGESPAEESVSQNFSSIAIQPLSPKRAIPVSPNLTADSATFERRGSGANEEEWQKQHEMAMAADPNRPRTLKEARALAKERARLRNQSKGGASESSGLTISHDISSPQSTTISQHSSTGTSDTRSPTNDSQQRQDHRHAQVISLPAESNAAAAVVTTYSKDDPNRNEAMPEGKQNLPQVDRTLVDMSDLQAAVGEALEDVSFTSSATSATATAKTGNAEQTPIQGSSQLNTSEKQVHRLDTNVHHLSPTNIPLSIPSDVDVESMTHSVTSFDSARESPTSHASPYVSAANLPGSPSGNQESSEEVQPPVIPVIQAADHFRQPSAFAYAASQNAYDPNIRQQGHAFIPHNLQAHQRSTAPNKIARLDVYGKSVAWPAAFEPAAIIEQKRLAPWERARSYAHYCNDLMTTPTGIHVWLDMVQRPAQRAAAAAAAAAAASNTQGNVVRRHVRGEGTDGSGYAASVRSDATFPVRGDGGKAKEIVAHHPSEASIPENPNAIPQSLPYPSLVSSSSTSPLIRHHTRPSQDGLQGTSLPSSNSLGDRRDPRGFFSNLGRKSSSRRTQGQGIGFSSFTGASNSPSKAGISSIRSRGISVPAPTGSSPNMKTIPIGGSQSLDQTMPTPLKATQSPSIIPSTDSNGSFMTTGSPNNLMKSMDSSNNLPSSQSLNASRNGPQGPRALGNSPSYFASLNSTRTTRNDSIASVQSIVENERVGLHGLSPTGGIYSIPANASSNSHLNAPTDYSSSSSPTSNGVVERRSPRGNAPALPALTSVKNSLSYQSVKDPNRRPTLQPPIRGESSGHSSDSHSSSISPAQNSGNAVNLTGSPNPNSLSANSPTGIARTLGRRRSSNLVHAMTAEESEALDKLCDVLPDADRLVLLEYLRRANGNDLAAIGDYLQDQSKAEQSRHMR